MSALVLAGHEMLRSIGVGSYGEVWMARNIVGTLRAVKIVHRKSHESAEGFEREFKGLQRFEPVSRMHEGLVDVLQIGVDDPQNCFYYVMELADGVGLQIPKPITNQLNAPQREDSRSYQPRSLRADLRIRAPFPVEEVIELGLKLTSALAYLHSHGLVHRDVKPSNILFIAGQPKLADPGLVAPLGDARSLVGTTGYIAPEGPGTAQADVYALGKVLYEAAFNRDRQEFPALPSNIGLRGDHGRLLELNAILLKACGTTTRERYASALSMLDDLNSLKSGQPIRRKHLQQRICSIGARAALAIGFVGLIISFTVTLSRRDKDEDMRSRVPQVNKLVADGNVCILSSTRERLEKGIEFFEQALALDPAFIPAQSGIQFAFVALGDLEGARACAKKLSKMDADSAEAFVARGYQLWIDWRFQESLELLRHASEHPAHSRLARSRAHLAYGFHLLQTGQIEAAKAQYEKAAELATKWAVSDPSLEHHLGHPYFAQRNFAEALKHYERSLEIEPRHWQGHYWKGRTYEAMGEFEKAIREFRAVDLAGQSDDAASQRYYGELLDATMRCGAEGYWRKQLECVLNESTVDLYRVATLFAQLRDWPKAYEYLEKACAARSFTQGLMFDLCWNHADKRFQEIVKKIGLVP